MTDASGTGSIAVARRRGGHDRLLDLIRSVAILRVVLWHTWSWAWLSWVPAMPAMFFTTGALLQPSLQCRGWSATLVQRCRRLFPPYWLYAAACVAVMCAFGWRPSLLELVPWAVPLADPIGSDDFAGLWVPLWYVRSYLWFLVIGGAIAAATRRFGWGAVGGAAAIAGASFLLSGIGFELPMALGDGAAYLPFVAAGMAYASGRTAPGRNALAAMALASVVASITIWQRLGPADGVVNRSYLLTTTVGMAGLMAVLALAGQLRSVADRHSELLRVVNSRALTIYLWQGFGLVAAQRLVGTRVDALVPRAVLSLAVVVVVIVAAVLLVGGAEDLAAGRAARRPRPASLPLAGAGLALCIIGLAVPVPAGSALDAPLSGQAVLQRADEVQRELDGSAATVDLPDVSGLSVQKVIERWVTEHERRLGELGTGLIKVAALGPAGEVVQAGWRTEEAVEPESLAWMSMTKSVTAAWSVLLEQQGVLSLDDQLSRWVPEVPRAHEITLEQLARHRGGIPVELDRSFFDTDPRAEIDGLIASGDLAYEPGEGFGYSRIGYYLLALAAERASGVPYTAAVSEMAERSGAAVRFDDVGRDGPVTDPDGHGYRGGPWASGGLLSEVSEASRFLHWMFLSELGSDGVGRISRFGSDPESRYYGLGVLPLCPCEDDGDWVRASRFGVDTLAGLFGVDPSSGATVVIQADVWWDGEMAEPAFHELLQQLLDVAGTS